MSHYIVHITCTPVHIILYIKYNKNFNKNKMKVKDKIVKKMKCKIPPEKKCLHSGGGGPSGSACEPGGEPNASVSSLNGSMNVLSQTSH